MHSETYLCGQGQWSPLPVWSFEEAGGQTALFWGLLSSAALWRDHLSLPHYTTHIYGPCIPSLSLYIYIYSMYLCIYLGRSYTATVDQRGSLLRVLPRVPRYQGHHGAATSWDSDLWAQNIDEAARKRDCHPAVP